MLLSTLAANHPCCSPSPDQAWPRPDFWKFGNLEPGNLEIWDPTKSKKIQILKIKIRSAQNVGKVQISREKSSWPIWGSFQANFSIGRKHKTNCQLLLIFLAGPMGPIHPGWALFTILLPNLVETVVPQLQACDSCQGSRIFMSTSCKPSHSLHYI